MPRRGCKQEVCPWASLPLARGARLALSLREALSSFEGQLKDPPPQANLLITSRRTPPDPSTLDPHLRAAVTPLSGLPVWRASEITTPSLCPPIDSVPSQEKVAYE